MNNWFNSTCQHDIPMSQHSTTTPLQRHYLDHQLSFFHEQLTDAVAADARLVQASARKLQQACGNRGRVHVFYEDLAPNRHDSNEPPTEVSTLNVIFSPAISYESPTGMCTPAQISTALRTIAVGLRELPAPASMAEEEKQLAIRVGQQAQHMLPYMDLTLDWYPTLKDTIRCADWLTERLVVKEETYSRFGHLERREAELMYQTLFGNMYRIMKPRVVSEKGPLRYSRFTPPWLRKNIVVGRFNIILDSDTMPELRNQRNRMGERRIKAMLAAFFEREALAKGILEDLLSKATPPPPPVHTPSPLDAPSPLQTPPPMPIPTHAHSPLVRIVEVVTTRVGVGLREVGGHLNGSGAGPSGMQASPTMPMHAHAATIQVSPAMHSHGGMQGNPPIGEGTGGRGGRKSGNADESTGMEVSDGVAGEHIRIQIGGGVVREQTGMEISNGAGGGDGDGRGQQSGHMDESSGAEGEGGLAQDGGEVRHAGEGGDAGEAVAMDEREGGHVQESGEAEETEVMEVVEEGVVVHMEEGEAGGSEMKAEETAEVERRESEGEDADRGDAEERHDSGGEDAEGGEGAQIRHGGSIENGAERAETVHLVAET